MEKKVIRAALLGLGTVGTGVYKVIKNQHSDRNLTGSVHTYIEDIVGISFVFQPCSSVRDDGAGK